MESTAILRVMGMGSDCRWLEILLMTLSYLGWPDVASVAGHFVRPSAWRTAPCELLALHAVRLEFAIASRNWRR